jgi:hypothetical protein
MQLVGQASGHQPAKLLAGSHIGIRKKRFAEQE